MKMTFAVKKAPTPPEPEEWAAHLDDSAWELEPAYSFTGQTWDDTNQEWDSGTLPINFELVAIRPIGTWAEGYKPTKMRITFTGATYLDVGLADNEGQTIGQIGNTLDYIYTSGEEIDLTFLSSDRDIGFLFIAAELGTSFSITNIEFSEVLSFRSIVIDMADNYGGTYAGLRELDLYYQGTQVDVSSIGYDAYASDTVYSNGYPQYAFDNTLSLVDTWSGKSWLSSFITDQRLVCTLDNRVDIDKLIAYNFHDSGLHTTRGMQNVKVYGSRMPVDRAIYGAEIPNSFKLYDGTFSQHTAVNEEDPQEYSSLTRIITNPVYYSFAKSVVFDFADGWGDTYLGVRRIEFWLSGKRVDITEVDYTAYATTTYTTYYPKYAFDTSLSLINASTSVSWFGTNGNQTNQRLIITLPKQIRFNAILFYNFHSTGGNTNRGAKTAEIYTTLSTITDTTYGAAISGSKKIWEGELFIHPTSNTRGSEILTIIPGGII